MLSTITLLFFLFFLHFKFLSWHSSCTFQVSRDSSLITHGSSLITHGSSLITHHSSWLLASIKTPGSPHDSWLPSWLLAPLLTSGSWLLAIVFFFNVNYGKPCSFIFCYMEKPRGNSDRPFFTFWQKTWGTPDRPFFTFWQKTSRNFDPPFYISLNKVKLFTTQTCSLYFLKLSEIYSTNSLLKTLWTVCILRSEA